MLKLEFETSNAAYRDLDGEPDLEQVAYTVSEVVDALRAGVRSGIAYDYNGNRIGYYELTE